jgi:predicted O-methyltransferase YrrM
MMLKDVAKRLIPERLLRFRRQRLQAMWQKKLLAQMAPAARRLYELSQAKYDVELGPEIEILRRKVEELAHAQYGESWNYYSDALRPEIVEGFVKTVAAIDRPSVDYLEIGSCQGLSMSLMASLLRRRNVLGTLTSVDPYLASGYDEGELGPYAQRVHVEVNKTTRDCAARLYAQLGFTVELREQLSVDGLRALLAEGRRFDLIYIDGSHEQLWPAVDFGLSFALLQPGGIIILDDHHWPDVEPIRELCDRHGTLIQKTWKTASYRFGNG